MLLTVDIMFVQKRKVDFLYFAANCMCRKPAHSVANFIRYFTKRLENKLYEHQSLHESMYLWRNFTFSLQSKHSLGLSSVTQV